MISAAILDHLEHAYQVANTWATACGAGHLSAEDCVLTRDRLLRLATAITRAYTPTEARYAETDEEHQRLRDLYRDTMTLLTRSSCWSTQ